jgi:translation elongation factor EF-1beta
MVFYNKSKIEKEIQTKIRNKAREERAEERRVKMGFQKLIVNQEWKWDREKNVLKKIAGLENYKIN